MAKARTFPVDPVVRADPFVDDAVDFWHWVATYYTDFASLGQASCQQSTQIGRFMNPVVKDREVGF